MVIYNQTPFTYLPFWSLDADKKRHFTLAVRGTFKIDEEQNLILFEEQEKGEEPEYTDVKRAIIVADSYYGDSGTSSLHWPNDLSPYKPNADIHIIGHAKSGNEEPQESWKVSVHVGDLQSELEVHAPREWAYGEDEKWNLSELKTCTEVPLRYEYASGGTWINDDEGDFSESNPIGKGCCKLQNLDESIPVKAPQILGVGEEIPELGTTNSAIGLGPIPPSWTARLEKAGTYDEDWEENQHPLPPHDFNYAFYNSASPDLIYKGHLIGGEKVALKGLHASGELSFELPNREIKVTLIDSKDEISSASGVLDTLQMDLEKKLVYLVWRVFVPFDGKLKKIKIEEMDNSSIS